MDKLKRLIIIFISIASTNGVRVMKMRKKFAQSFEKNNKISICRIFGSTQGGFGRRHEQSAKSVFFIRSGR